MLTGTQSKFETMYEAIDCNPTSKVQDVVATLSAKKNIDEIQKFVLWVAECVLNDRKVGA